MHSAFVPPFAVPQSNNGQASSRMGSSALGGVLHRRTRIANADSIINTSVKIGESENDALDDERGAEAPGESGYCPQHA